MKRGIIILFLISLPPLLWWFPAGSVVDGTDIIFPLNPVLNLQRGFYAWDPINLTGSYQSAVQLNLSKFPIYLILSFLNFLGFSISWVNRFWYFAYLFFPALAFFLFTTEFFYERKNKYLLGLISASFYIFNLYYVQQIIDQAITLSLIFAPIYLFLILKGLRTQQVLLYSLMVGVLNFFYSPINPNSYLAGIAVILFFVMGLSVKLLISKAWRDIGRLLQILILSAILGLLSGAYFILPTYYYLQTSTGAVKDLTADWLTGVSKYTYFSNVVRLLGAWDWFESWNHEFYMPFAQIYFKNFFFSLLSWIPPFLALAGLIFSVNRWKYFFAGLAILGIILSMGSQQPTDRLYFFLYNHLPLFWIFRSPWYKFGLFIIFAYSGLIWLFAEVLFKKYSPKKVTAVLILLFIILAHPIFFGNRFTQPKDRQGNLASLINVIPAYVFQTADWLNSQKDDNRVVMVPQLAWESTIYNWGFGNLVPPLYTLLRKNPVLYLPYVREGPGVELLKLSKQSLYNPDSTPSAKYLKFLGAKYLVNQKDFNYFYFRAPENEILVDWYINKQNGLEKIKTFGSWDIYLNKFYLPKIYKVDKIESVEYLAQIEKFDLNKNLAFTVGKNPAGNEDFSAISDNGGQFNFFKISPSEYRIRIRTNKPFYLIFNEAFDQNWRVFDGKNDLSKDHFLVNSFANAYKIKKTGTYDLVLKFLPQENFNRGFRISLTAVFLELLLISMLLLKKKMLKFARKFKNHD